jgi:hypothetical protein
MGFERQTASLLWLALIWPALSAVAFNFTNTIPTQCDPLTINWKGAYTECSARTRQAANYCAYFSTSLCEGGTPPFQLLMIAVSTPSIFELIMPPASQKAVLTHFIIFCVICSPTVRCITSLSHRLHSTTMRGASRFRSSFCPSSSASCSPCPMRQVFPVGG